jgi:hypothetical protein
MVRMSRSVKQDYPPKVLVGGRRSGKRALARQTAAQYARDQIEVGVDPGTTMTFYDVSGITRVVTYEEAAEMAFVGDIIDQQMNRIMGREIA